MQIPIPKENGSFLSILWDVFSADATTPLGIGAWDRKILAANNATHEFRARLSGSSMPLESKFRHLKLYRGDDEVLYTTSELVKLHRDSCDPSSGKPYELIKRKTKPS